MNRDEKRELRQWLRRVPDDQAAYCEENFSTKPNSDCAMASTRTGRVKSMVAVLRYWILLLLGTTCLGHVELSTRLSSDSISELESVRLVIRDHGAQQTETDLTELQNNFHIMGNNTSKQYQYINGRTQSWVDYQITLAQTHW